MGTDTNGTLGLQRRYGAVRESSTKVREAHRMGSSRAAAVQGKHPAAAETVVAAVGGGAAAAGVADVAGAAGVAGDAAAVSVEVAVVAASAAVEAPPNGGPAGRHRAW